MQTRLIMQHDKKITSGWEQIKLYHITNIESRRHIIYSRREFENLSYCLECHKVLVVDGRLGLTQFSYKTRALLVSLAKHIC